MGSCTRPVHVSSKKVPTMDLPLQRCSLPGDPLRHLATVTCAATRLIIILELDGRRLTLAYLSSIPSPISALYISPSCFFLSYLSSLSTLALSDTPRCNCVPCVPHPVPNSQILSIRRILHFSPAKTGLSTDLFNVVLWLPSHCSWRTRALPSESSFE
ncbi:hypothetical protein BJX76DRAFT_77622 [Aspergillus varians]